MSGEIPIGAQLRQAELAADFGIPTTTAFQMKVKALTTAAAAVSAATMRQTSPSSSPFDRSNGCERTTLKCNHPISFCDGDPSAKVKFHHGFV
jgi:hypothetical protein